MVSITYWRDGRGDLGGSGQIIGRTYGELFDRLEGLGAFRALTGLGEVYRKIGGEWIVMPAAAKGRE